MSKISEIELLDDAEQEKVLDEWNDTKTKYDRHALLHELVAESAAKRDEDTAVIFGDTHVTYGQLNRRANGIAKRLVEEGIKAGDNVGVMLDRSPAMVSALLGVMKAGATYIPLDPEFPEGTTGHDAGGCRAAFPHRVEGDPAQGAQGRLDHVLTADTIEATADAPESARGHRGIARLHHLHIRFHRQTEGSRNPTSSGSQFPLHDVG